MSEVNASRGVGYRPNSTKKSSRPGKSSVRRNAILSGPKRPPLTKEERWELNGYPYLVTQVLPNGHRRKVGTMPAAELLEKMKLQSVVADAHPSLKSQWIIEPAI